MNVSRSINESFYSKVFSKSFSFSRNCFRFRETQLENFSIFIFCQSSILSYKKNIFIEDTQSFQQFMLLFETNAETKSWLDAKHEVISHVSYQSTIIYLLIYLFIYVFIYVPIYLSTKINR